LEPINGSQAPFFTPPEESFFLFGARGVGNSTILKSKFKEDRVLDLLDPSLFRKLMAKPGQADLDG
jgi:hypothetical protein